MSRHHLRHLLPLPQVVRSWRYRRAGTVANRDHLAWTYRLEHGFLDFAFPPITLHGSMRKFSIHTGLTVRVLTCVAQLVHQPIWCYHGRSRTLLGRCWYDCLLRAALVSRAMECRKHRHWCHCCDRRPKVYLQDPDCCLPLPRVQARRDQQSLVDCKLGSHVRVRSRS